MVSRTVSTVPTTVSRNRLGIVATALENAPNAIRNDMETVFLTDEHLIFRPSSISTASASSIVPSSS